jgi:hypothetical protein
MDRGADAQASLERLIEIANGDAGHAAPSLSFCIDTR